MSDWRINQIGRGSNEGMIYELLRDGESVKAGYWMDIESAIDMRPGDTYQEPGFDVIGYEVYVREKREVQDWIDEE